MRYSNWYRIYMCGDHELSRDTVMYSGGVCPICGKNSNSTVCHTQRIAVRRVYHRPWYIFWQTPTIETKKY
jgi:hypothetical protein